MKKRMMMTNMSIITIMTRKTNMSIITMTTMSMTMMSMSIIITTIITTIMTMKAEKLRNTESVHLSTTAANLSTWASSMIS